MMELICLLSPAFLSTYLLEKHLKTFFHWKEFAVTYFTFTGLINMCALGITAYFSDRKSDIVNAALFKVSFSFKYLILGFFLAIVLPAAYAIIKQCIQIELIVERVSSDEKQ